MSHDCSICEHHYTGAATVICGSCLDGYEKRAAAKAVAGERAALIAYVQAKYAKALSIPDGDGRAYWTIAYRDILFALERGEHLAAKET